MAFDGRGSRSAAFEPSLQRGASRRVRGSGFDPFAGERAAQVLELAVVELAEAVEAPLLRVRLA